MFSIRKGSEKNLFVTALTLGAFTDIMDKKAVLCSFLDGCQVRRLCAVLGRLFPRVATQSGERIRLVVADLSAENNH